MWKMVQKDEPDDFVIATGETHTVREFVEKAFEAVGTEIGWHGEGVGEIGYDKSVGPEKVLIRVDPRCVGSASPADYGLHRRPSLRTICAASCSGTSARRKSTCCSGIRPRPNASSAGRSRSLLRRS